MGVGSSTLEAPSPSTGAKGAPNTLGEQDRWTIQQLRDMFEELVRNLPVGADGRVGKADLEAALRELSIAAGLCSANLCDWSTLSTDPATSSKDAARLSRDADKAVQHDQSSEEEEGTTDGDDDHGDTPQDDGSEQDGDEEHCDTYGGYGGVWEEQRLEEMGAKELRAYKAQLLLKVDEAMIEANELLGKAMAAQAVLDIECIQRLIDSGRYTELGILVARMLHKLFSRDTHTHAYTHTHSPRSPYPCASCGDRDSARHTHADYCRRLSTYDLETEFTSEICDDLDIDFVLVDWHDGTASGYDGSGADIGGCGGKDAYGAFFAWVRAMREYRRFVQGGIVEMEEKIGEIEARLMMLGL